MKETGKIQNMDNLIEEELRAAFGYGEEDLIAEFDEAASQMEESDRVPPEGEFEKILSRVRELEAEKKAPKKVVRLKRVGKIGLLVAVLGCVLLGTGIGVSGNRFYNYNVREVHQGKSSAWNNTGNLEADYKIDEAYQEIYNKLGIDVLRLLYIPEKMEFSKLSFGDGYARIEFTYKDKYIYFIQSQDPVDNAGSTISDCKEVKTIYNKALKCDLTIKQNNLSEGIIEFSTEFVIDKAYYHLTAVVPQEEFELMLSKINR